MWELSDEIVEESGLSREKCLDIITPITIGPTWKRDEDGDWILPEHTLGWEIAVWCAKYLRAPGGGQWKFTMEQLRFVLWWYAVDERGQWVYRTGVLQRCKGWGKDPLLAVLSLVEFVGPCRFSHWGKDGSPVAKPVENAWVTLAATSMDQNKNTMRALPGLVTDALRQDYGIKSGPELWRAHGGRNHLEAVASNYRTIEGNRTTFTVLNETHHHVSTNGGHDMFETIDGNTTKIAGARYLAITNAFLPGEDSVAERMRHTYELIEEGRAESARFLYDSVEAKADAPTKGPLVPLILDRVRGDAHWLDVQATMDSMQQAHITPARSRRMYYNQVVASEEALYGPRHWDPLRVCDQGHVGCAEHGNAELKRGDQIALGFDGGRTDDATALIAIRTSDMTAFRVGIWEAPEHTPKGGWVINHAAVDAEVRRTFATYDVVAFFADVALWESYINGWAEDYGEGLLVKATDRNPIAWDMRGGGEKVPRAHESLMSSIYEKRLHHDGDRTLRRHLLNAQEADTKWGTSFRKETPDSPRKVDAYAALMLAHEALTKFRLSGKDREVVSGLGYFL